MKTSLLFVLNGLLFFALPFLAAAQWQASAMTETRHILRSEWPAANAVAKLFAARNERASIQILLRSEQPVEGINVEAGDLRGPNGFALHGADSRLYREHQLHLAAGTYRNDSFKADWYPDPLIPFGNPTPEDGGIDYARQGL